MPSFKGSLTPFAAVALLLSVSPGFAQEPADIAPRPPEPMPSGEVVVEDPEEPEIDPDAEILLEHIRSLVFYGDPDDTQPLAEHLDEGIVVRGLDIPSEPRFRTTIEPFLERPLTFQALQRIARQTVLHYRAEDYPVVDVIVPEQDISDGVVRILILEGRITTLRTQGNRYFANALLRREIRLKPGERIRGETVRQDIEWLNRNPFRQVDAVFTPGETPGDTELILMTEDRPPVRFYAGYENTGHPSTGRSRFLAGLNWGNAFGLDHQFNYQFTFNDDLESFRAHAGSYTIPLPSRHIVTFYGSYIDTAPDIEDPFELTGSSAQIGTRYSVPLSTPRHATFSHEARVGADFKRTDTNLQFGGFEVFDAAAEIFHGVAGYETTWADEFGRNFAGIDVFYAPGNATRRNRNATIDAAREGAVADYVYTRLHGERETDLPLNLFWNASGEFQATSDRLFFSEQIGIGGYRTVRGYMEREANGDGGFFLRNELLTPEWPALDQNHRIRFLAFIDAGEARIRSPRENEDRSVFLAGAGAGVRYRIGRYFDARLDLAFPLRDGPATDSGRTRLHAGVTASW